jgi:hypothetical protein
MSPGAPTEGDLSDEETEPIEAEVVEPLDVVDVYPSSIDGILDSGDFQLTFIENAPDAWNRKEMLDAKGNKIKIKKGMLIIRHPAFPAVFMPDSKENRREFVLNGLVWNQGSGEGVDLGGSCADTNIVVDLVEQDERPLLNRLFHDPESFFRRERKPATSLSEIQRRQRAEQSRREAAVVDGYPATYDRARSMVDALYGLDPVYLALCHKRAKDIDGVTVSKNKTIIHNGDEVPPTKFLLDTPENRVRFISNNYRLEGL